MSQEHWDDVYAGRDHDDVSWYQSTPRTSIQLVTNAAAAGRVVDVGAGASTLADELVARGYDVTIVDVAPNAIETVRRRLGDRASYVVTDLLAWTPEADFDVWHDRAVFHFLTDSDQQSTYVDLAAAAVRPQGAVVLGAFAPDGPAMCSGLPTARHDADSLAAIFGRRFDLVSSGREEHVTPWGAVQPFTWVTLRRRA